MPFPYIAYSRLWLIAYPILISLLMGYFLSVPGLILFNAVSGTGNTNKSMKIMALTMTVYIIYVGIMVFYLKSDITIARMSEYTSG